MSWISLIFERPVSRAIEVMKRSGVRDGSRVTRDASRFSMLLTALAARS